METPNQENRTPEGPESPKAGQAPEHSKRPARILPFLFTFCIMFIVWMLLSGKFDPFHLSLGIISCVLVSFFSGDLLFNTPGIGGFPASWVRFIRYLPWLVYQIFLANLHLLYLSFHPRMMDLIDPKMIRFKSRLQKNLSLVTFANSITLTPGTITVYVSMDGEFTVHAIDKKSGEGLPGEMEARILKAFSEE